MAKTTAETSDSESCDDLPELLDLTDSTDWTDDEDSGKEEYYKKPLIKANGKAWEKPAPKARNNAECADMWYKMSKDEREKHIHVMRVYLLSPFLFGQVCQEDKWINWAYDCKLLPSKSSFGQKCLDEQYFDAVDLVETAFNKLADNVLLENKDGLVKTFDIIGSAGMTMAQHLDKAITCAESFLAFTGIRDKIKLKSGISKKQGDMALLLAHYQVADHIKQLAAGKDPVEKFNKRCKDEEDQTANQKKEGNEAFSHGKFKAAISAYSRALHVSPYNHVLYDNRSMSYLKTKDLWSALTDGRRAVVLKADWHKAQYRYAQAFFEMGNFTRAKEVNRAACKICTDKKDLESQFEKFEKAFRDRGKTSQNKKTSKATTKKYSLSSQPEDLPDLVYPDSSDTSSINSEDECLPYLGDMESSEDSHDSDNNKNEDSHSDSGDVPLEIVVRGPVALKAYNKALAEGKTFDKRVPVMLIGQDRSGKTSLRKSLMGEPFNPDEESTVGIDVDPSHFNISTEIWKAGEKDQETISKTSISFEYHAARVTVENLKQEKSVVKETIPRGTTDLANSDFIPLSPASYSCLSDVTSTSTQALQSPLGTTVLANNDFIPQSPASYSSVALVSEDSERGSNIPSERGSNIPKDVENEMLQRMQNDHKMEDEEGIYSVLWDFAGQLVYYVTHPLFLTSRAMYLLVNDLSQNPSETAKPVVKQGVYGKFEDSFGMKTNMDYLAFWLSSIASIACENERGPIGFNSEVLPEKLPPVLLVCTHADKPYDGGDPNALARELFGSLQTKPYSKHLHDVFVVDNTKSSLESECPEVVRLRNEVLAIAKELPQMKEAIPIKWLKFEKELQAASKEDHKWISLETATSIASEKCNVVDSKEFKTLLNFLHDKRILVHFDDTPELNELVVLDPQWLIDVFKKVITVKPYDCKGKKFTELWRKLENKGILEEKLLEQVWGPLFNNRATCESLLQIMGKFSLLCPWPSSDSPCGKQYLVPAMLRTHPPEDIMKLVQVASRRIPPLFLKFESGQVPLGLFPRLVLLFLQWGKQISLHPERTKLFHHFARFFTSEEENWSVILLCLSSSIKVVVYRENPIRESGVESLPSADANYDTSDVTFPCEVHRLLEKILESMRKEFCWLKFMRYETSFICPVCCQGGAVHYCDTHHVQGCKQEECLHFWSQSQLCDAKKIISCTKSVAAVNSRVQIVQFVPWFTTLGNQLTTDQQDGDNLAFVEESEAKALVLSSGVLKSLQTTCDPENVVALLPESLKLDEATLADPGPEKTRFIRCLSMVAKNANRPDVVKHLRQMTPAGTTGPLLPERLDVKDVSQSQLRKLTINLCGGEEWKILAEKLGLSPAEIRFLDKRTRNPCIELLSYIRSQRFIDVGTLYDALVECGFPVWADML